MAERQCSRSRPRSAQCPRSQRPTSHRWCASLTCGKNLAETDRQAILALPFTTRRLEPGQYLVWDGDKPQYACLLLSGFAFRHKHAGNGGRQILSIHMKGDIVDLQNSLLGVADHNVQMLTAGEVAMIPADNVREIAFSHPTVGMAMWYETLVEGSIFREWVLNIGRRDARTRIAHLLCEFASAPRGRRAGAADRLRIAAHAGAACRRGRADPGPRQPNADEAGGRRADQPHQAGHFDHRLEEAREGRRLPAALPPPRQPERDQAPSKPAAALSLAARKSITPVRPSTFVRAVARPRGHDPVENCRTLHAHGRWFAACSPDHTALNRAYS